MLRPTILFAAVLAASCRSGSASDPTPPAPPPIDDAGPSGVPFQADPPSVYVGKVKNLLVGLPPTDDEIAKVTADLAALAPLIDGWMQLPQYAQKMMRFFELAFQQTQISIADFADQTSPRPAGFNPVSTSMLVQNASESFARTMLELDEEGQPLTLAATTTRFMMTPALVELYAFLDAWQVDDQGKVVDRFAKDHPGLTVGVTGSGPIPIAQTLDPSSPNYMRWYDPDLATVYPYYEANTGYASCPTGDVTYPPILGALAPTLHYVLYGTLDNRFAADAKLGCLLFPGTAASPQLKGDDFSSWRMVTIRPPAPGEPTTAFYDLPTLRAANELVLSIPRVGFFTTPAFFANWQTNTSNQMRVTINQALIVATGASIDGSDMTAPQATPGLDAEHAAPGSSCFSCHRLLDPSRSILAATYSVKYHTQTDAKFTSQLGQFAFQGVVAPVASVADLGRELAQHPLFASAWVQKLCYYATSAACAPDDPEFLRVVDVFKASGYRWSALVRELMASPLVTYASPTKTTTDAGQVVAVARRDHLCAALDARLELTDVCGLDVLSSVKKTGTIPEIVGGLPSDGYGRGATAPVLPNEPTLFYRAGTENICAAVADLVIDPANAPPGAKKWSAAAPDAAIADFVAIVMGLAPSDARAAPSKAVLSAHFAQAVQGGAAAGDALKSTFVLACLAPSAVSIGF